MRYAWDFLFLKSKVNIRVIVAYGYGPTLESGQVIPSPRGQQAALLVFVENNMKWPEIYQAPDIFQAI